MTAGPRRRYNHSSFESEVFDMEKTKKSLFGPMDLTKGTCWKTILIFSLPVILSYLLQQG